MRASCCLSDMGAEGLHPTPRSIIHKNWFADFSYTSHSFKIQHRYFAIWLQLRHEDASLHITAHRCWLLHTFRSLSQITFTRNSQKFKKGQGWKFEIHLTNWRLSFANFPPEKMFVDKPGLNSIERNFGSWQHGIFWKSHILKFQARKRINFSSQFNCNDWFLQVTE